ncbi:type II toxin-antitoxin system Phd/YefM family antitoxin [Tessaracoccus massiliensis]|uniref:type II toxin-antitoxin system Phd/YefM family antitoxin n=1 Tax=Tessaracoccus massiliensis TaxID=1522311 RepID=UPI00058FCE8A|nr:type II toxin-antitoxin system prevent-host-death family antitoxin [Tessaracoccus massiliensis]
MAGTISVGELRRNPTPMLRDVKSGQTYTVTDHGEPIATLMPIRPAQWTRVEDLNVLLMELGGDAAWARESALDRDAEDPRARDAWPGDRPDDRRAAAHGAAVLTRNVQDVEGLEGFVPIIQA